MKHTLKEGYVEGGHIHCPHCNGWDFIATYPKGKVVFCIYCNKPYRVPDIQDKSELLTKEQREQGFSLMVENHNEAILMMDGKELKRWRRDQLTSYEQVYKEINELFAVCL